MHKTQKFYVPETYAELFIIIKELKEKFAFVAGGVTINWRGNNFPVLISIENLIDNEIDETTNSIKIGAGVKLSALEKFDNKIFQALSQAAALVASPQIRNMATLGGNVISHFDFSDTLGVIYILKPQFEIITETGVEIIDFEKYYSTQSNRIILPKNAILNKFVFPKNILEKYEKSGYIKETRVGRDIATIGVTVFKQKNNKYDISVMGCWTNIECFFDIEKIETIKSKISELPPPKSDLRASGDYRSKIITHLIEKALTL